LEPAWVESLDALPPALPLILLSNELLDCLPARQFVRTERGWAERMVGLDSDSALAFGLATRPLDRLLPEAEPGTVVEISAAQEAFGAMLGARLARDGGVALLIDYGRSAPGYGDTLQALLEHSKISPLDSPGEADLTVHADFPAVAEAARKAGAAAAPILEQGAFLRRLGLSERAQALMRARPDRADVIQRQVARLTDADQMGSLFKALALHAPAALIPPGFEEG
jgi:NADH dehydrogenase [ubiquinone] 1 alpha subcomplex assembly factor 7